MACIFYFGLFFSEVCSYEEADVLQHACALRSKEPDRDSGCTQRQEEKFDAAARGMHPDAQPRSQKRKHG